MSNYDEIDLKDQIRRLKAVKAQFEIERKGLEEETAKREVQLQQLRHEFNVVAPSDEIRFTSEEMEGPGANSIDNKRFRLWNNKVEMMLMCTEIRNALPALEAEAAKYEGRVKDSTKTAKKSEKEEMKFPPLLLKSTAELEDIVGAQMDRRFELKASLTGQVDDLKRQKLQISNDIANYRRYLTQLWDEKELLANNNNTIDNALYQEQVQLEILKKQHIERRDAFKKFHNGKGWEAEAFLSVAGSLGGEIPVSKLPRLLSQWIMANARDTFTVEYLVGQIKTVSDLNDRYHHSPSQDELYAMSDEEQEELIVVKKEGSRRRSSKEANTLVDFTVFCKLCDRLVILHEAQE